MKGKQNKGKKNAKVVIKTVFKKAKQIRKVKKQNKSFGSKIGGFIGNAAQNMIGRITGLGDYHVGGSRQVGLDNGPPQFASGRTTRIAHREYLGDITGSVAFEKTTFELNPGDAQTFPWLRNIAVNYEEYKFHGLVFEFKSTSASSLNSTNTALGTVICATQYDSVEPVFSNKRTMENHEFATSTKPSQSVLHGVETKPSLTSISTNLYVLNGAQPPDTDIRLYNLGKFTIATVGMQAAANIGELWVSYDIEFFKPQLLEAGATNIYSHWTTSNDRFIQSRFPFGSNSATTPAGAEFAMTIVPGSTVGLITFAVNEIGGEYGWGKLMFPTPGTYYVILNSQWPIGTGGGLGEYILSSSDEGVDAIGEVFNYTVPTTCSIASSNATSTSAPETKGIFVTCLNTQGPNTGVQITTDATNGAYTDIVVIPVPHYFSVQLSKIEKLEDRLRKLLTLKSQYPVCTTPEQEKFVDLSESTVLARAISRLGKR